MSGCCHFRVAADPASVSGMGSQSRVPQVLIVGAGIAGLAATGAIRGLAGT